MKTSSIALSIVSAALLMTPNIAAGCVATGGNCTGNHNNMRGTCCTGACVGADGRVLTSGSGKCVVCKGCLSPCIQRDWEQVETGFEQKFSPYCLCNFCADRTQYRCASGYYGKVPRAGSDCTKCPSMGNVSGVSEAGSNEITECYISTTTSFHDAKGTQHFTSKCQYTL